MRKLIFRLFTHGAALAVGFALGIYFLPILTAPADPAADMLQEKAEGALFSGEFTRELRGSDFLHWGEGKVSVSATEIVHEGELAPGPDYKLYLTKSFVEHEDEFNPVKADAALVGDVKTFGGFLVSVPDGVDVTDYTTVVVWCESFGEFITSVRYQ